MFFSAGCAAICGRRPASLPALGCKVNPFCFFANQFQLMPLTAYLFIILCHENLYFTFLSYRAWMAIFSFVFNILIKISNPNKGESNHHHLHHHHHHHHDHHPHQHDGEVNIPTGPNYKFAESESTLSITPPHTSKDFIIIIIIIITIITSSTTIITIITSRHCIM